MEDNKNNTIDQSSEGTNPTNQNDNNKKGDKKPNVVVRIINGIGRAHNWCKDKISKHPTGAATLFFTGGSLVGWALKGFVGVISDELSKMEDDDSDLLNSNVDDDVQQIDDQSAVENSNDD